MPHLSPLTLTHAEQKATLRATRRNPRDHLIYSLALGTGLRLAEIVGLNVGDIYTPDGRPKNRVRLRSEIAKNGRAGDVFLPDGLLAKFRRFWRHKARRREGLRLEDPLFCAQGGRRRISPRRVQFAFQTWQVKAGFERPPRATRWPTSRDSGRSWRKAPWSGGRRSSCAALCTRLPSTPMPPGGTITFYELPVTSLMSVPGARVALLQTLRSNRLDGFDLPTDAWRLAA